MNTVAVESATKDDLERAAEFLSRRTGLAFVIQWSEAPRRPSLACLVKRPARTVTLFGPASKADLYTWLKGFAKGIVWQQIAQSEEVTRCRRTQTK
jgi:hypothetical protein